MAEIIREISHQAGLLVDIEGVHGALSGRNRRNGMRVQVDAKYLRLAFHPGLESRLVRPWTPAQLARDEIEILYYQARWRSTRGRGNVQLRKLAASGLASKKNPLSVGRPARRLVLEGVIRN